MLNNQKLCCNNYRITIYKGQGMMQTIIAFAFMMIQIFDCYLYLSKFLEYLKKIKQNIDLSETLYQFYQLLRNNIYCLIVLCTNVFLFMLNWHSKWLRKKNTRYSIIEVSLLYPPQTKFGGYIGITLSVCPSMYLVSATPPKPLIGFLWNFTHL
jgi:hypothetical protein